MTVHDLELGHLRRNVGPVATTRSSRPDGTPTALELGVGTGRIAVPLARLGIRVHGIDLEPAMLEVLNGKQLPAGLTAAVGDMTDTSTFNSPDGITHYDLIYCVLATLTALPDGTAQRRCLASAASALNPGGRLVLEMPVPTELSTFDSYHRRVRHMGPRWRRLVGNGAP